MVGMPAMEAPTVELVGVITAADRRRAAKRNAVSLISPMPPPARGTKRRSADDFSTPSGKRVCPAREHNGATLARSPDYFGTPRRTFATGTYKNVYRGFYADGGEHDGEACVLKVFKTGDVFEDRYYAVDVSATERARVIVSAFNAGRHCNKKIYMNEASVWHDTIPQPDGRRKMQLVEPMIEGEFMKFNSNSGHSNGDQVMAALSHFSYHHTAGQHLLCDLQGGRYADCYVLTDPVIMSLDRNYGPTDLGERGISNFFARHRCSELCSPQWRKFLVPEATIPVREGSTMEDFEAPNAARLTQQQRLDELNRKIRLATEEQVMRGEISEADAQQTQRILNRAFRR